ncbi:S41 family peptidase [Chryseobacterium sp. LC2016-27]|uniref:S41 family peptidase n=1 Tax=Chryseobacterium sp. LC2016-27 TaxID=2897326 RepID=UPI001E308384|nr:S41 family peptidase [Chryseobacterium sp. LC2016-27]MCD0454232.1 S41 family peptidase [Chryseobacterium sp. LC2016-27]
MKKTLGLICLLSLMLNINAQKLKTSQDSTKVFYDKIFKALEVAYIHKGDQDWRKLKTETFKNLETAKDFKSSLKEVKVLFEKIGADHSKVTYQGKNYGPSVEISWENFSKQWMTKFASKPQFEAKILEGKYGYILMPNISFDDFSSENVHKIAQTLYDKIAELKTNNKLEGWIVDLRFNTGGNSTPMLLALYDLLGDNMVWGTLGIDKKLINSTKLNKGVYDQGEKRSAYIKPKGELIDKSKVAVLIGGLTASSGEVTALAFKGRPNTIFIGEKTLGKTTSNMVVTLPFDAIMPMSTGYDCDRNGNYYKQIPPDIIISKEDNFDDLLQDKNIQEGIQFFTKK